MSKRVYDDEQKPFSLKIWAKMVPFLKPYGGKILLIVLLMLFNAAVDISYPLFQGYAIDTFIIPQTVEGIWPFAILYFVILTLQSISTVLFCRLALRVEMYLGRDLKRSVFNHLQTLSFSYYNVTPVGTIVARTMSDTNKIGSMFAWSLVDIFWAASFVLGSMVTMLFINWKLALPIIAIVPLIAIITVVFQKRILAVNRRVRRINSDITRAYNEGITGARTSKTLVIEDQNLREFSEITEDMRQNSVRATMLNALYIPIIVFFSSLAVCFVLVQGGTLNMAQALQIGTLSVFINYALNIFEPIQRLAQIIANFISIQANIERVTDLLELEPRIQDSPEVIEKYGYPMTSKEQANYLHDIRYSTEKMRIRRINGDSKGRFKLSKKYHYLIDAPFPISHKCCDIMKKEPVKKYEKSTGKVAFVGTMACESNLRKQSYLKNGCNAFNSKRPISTPIGFWTEQDVLQYIKDNNIEIASAYGDILEVNNTLKTSKCDRTGCVFCGFGIELEKGENRYQRLERTHPQLHDYCMNKLGFKEVCEYMNIKYKREL